MIVPTPALAVLLLMQAVLPAAGDVPPDPHIRTVAYNGDAMVDLRVANGFAAVVEFAPDERVETVVVGNETGWDVAPNRLGNRVVVKPLASALSTNMVVVTDRRRYVFLISPDRGAETFVLRFSYPSAPKPAKTAATYRFRGDRSLYPVAMGDDDKRTTITWASQVSLPAIFAVDGRGHEALVNGRMMDDDYVIERVARRFVFRLGDRQAVAIRKPVGQP